MSILMMGLGNPGKKYEMNRHNVGFMFMDWMAQETCSMEHVAQVWKYDKYSDSDLFQYMLHASGYMLHASLAKPRTFMNKSGFTANKLTTNYQLPTTNLLVVHDDLDIRLGEFKIQQGKGPKVHNGLSSIESSLRFKDFWRVRIGIDNRERFAGTGEEYVLGNFMRDEKEILADIFPIIFEKLSPILAQLSNTSEG